MDEKAKETVEEYEKRILEERERLVQERDNKFAELLQTVEDNQKKDVSKEMMMAIKNRIIDLHDSVLEVEMNEGIKNIKEDRRLRGLYWFFAFMFRSKHLRNVLLAFIAGIILTLIPTVVYTSTLKNDNMPKFSYSPNSRAYPKPTYVQIINTPAQLKLIQNSPAIKDDDHEATVGAIVKLGATGLTVLSQQEIGTSTFELKPLGEQTDKVRVISGYTFLPNALLIRKVRDIQVIRSEIMIESAKKDPNLLTRDALAIGAGIFCPNGAKCFVIPKKNLELDYEKVEPIPAV